MSKKCDWCGKYHDERFIYDYYRSSNGRYRSYDFCSRACKYYFNEKTNLIKVNNNGLTPKEEVIESKRRDQDIKNRYGSWENYRRIQNEREKEEKRKVILTKLLLYLVCPYILFFLYKNNVISFLTLFILGFVWVIVSTKYYEDH